MVLAGAGSAQAAFATLWSWAGCSGPNLAPSGSLCCPPRGCVRTRAAERVPAEQRDTFRHGSTQNLHGEGQRPAQGHSRDSVCSGESGAEGLKRKRRLRKLIQNKGWSWVKLPQGQMATLALCRSPGTNQPEPRCHMAAFASVRVSSLGAAPGNAAQLLPEPSWCPPPQAGVQVWHSLPCTGSPAPGSPAGSGTSFPAALLGGGWQNPMGLWGAAAPALLAQHPTQLGQARHGAAGEGTARRCRVAQGPRGQFPTLPVHLCKVKR